jgi:hypothetical protein
MTGPEHNHARLAPQHNHALLKSRVSLVLLMTLSQAKGVTMGHASETAVVRGPMVICTLIYFVYFMHGVLYNHLTHFL